MASEIKVDTIVNAGGDNDSGIDLSTNDVVAVKTANTERMRVDASGGVAIGATSVSSGFKTELNHSGETYGLKLTNGSNSIRFGAGGPEISATGERLDIRTTDSNDMRIYTNNTERMRVLSDGGVALGTTSITGGGFDASTKFVIQNGTSGGECLGLQGTSTSATSMEMVVLRDGNNTQIGTIIGNASANTTSYGTSSDYRLKENVVDVDKPIEKLKKLKPKTYNMISDPDNKLDGFLAHELGEVIPNASHGVKDAVNDDGSIKPQQVDYGLVTPLLTAALQEAVAKIETLEAKVKALESK